MPPKPDSPNAVLPPAERSPIVRLALLGGLVAMLVVAAALVVLTQRQEAATAAAPGPQLAAQLDRLLQRPGTAAATGLAVRPLVVAAGDSEALEVAGPVCDALVERLARLPGLRVASCGSTRVALAAGLDDPALARVLAVRYVLGGRVASRPQGRLHVQLTLHEVDGARERWRLEQDLGPGEVQTLPTTVARRTGQALGMSTTAPEPGLLGPEQYERYIAAQRKARRPSTDDRRAALAEVEALLLEVPDYAPAQYLRLGLRSRLSMSADPSDSGRSEQELQARQAALLAEIRALGEQMLARDPGDRRAHVLLLNDAFQGGRWVEAFERVDTLLQHAEQHPGTLRIAARLHVFAGYLGRARELALLAAQRDALDPETHEVLAELHGMGGDDAAMQEFVAVAERLGHRQTGLLRAFAAYRAQDWGALTRSMTEWTASDQREADWVPGFVQALRDPGQREAAAQVLDAHAEALRTAMSGYFLEYALLGDVARSLGAVQHHARLAPAAWLEHLWWPELAPVRREAGFSLALADLGFPALWRVRGAPDLCSKDAQGRWRCR